MIRYGYARVVCYIILIVLCWISYDGGSYLLKMIHMEIDSELSLIVSGLVSLVLILITIVVFFAESNNVKDGAISKSRAFGLSATSSSAVKFSMLVIFVRFPGAFQNYAFIQEIIYSNFYILFVLLLVMICAVFDFAVWKRFREKSDFGK